MSESERDALQSSITLLREYRRGTLGAFVSRPERREQGLPHELDAEEQEIVRPLLAASDDEGTVVNILTTVGPTRAHDLLERVIVRRKKPATSLVLEPYFIKDLGLVTWLLERVEVGLTGILVTVRIWTTWPLEAELTKEVMLNGPLQWLGPSEVTDDTGIAMRFQSAGNGGGSPVRISSSEWSGTRLAGRYSSWWSPGVAIEARSLSLTVGGDIVVDRWLNGNPGSFESVRVNLSPTTITLELPEHGRRILLM